MNKNTDFTKYKNNDLKKNDLKVDNNIIFSEYLKITPYCSSYNLLNTNTNTNDIVAFNEIIDNTGDYCNK
jgi:hypothetical protein